MLRHYTIFFASWLASVCLLRGDAPNVSSKPMASVPVAAKSWTASPVQETELVIENFSKAYVASGKPRFLIFLNRDLIRDRGEMLEMANNQKSIQTKGDHVEPDSAAAPMIYNGGTSVQQPQNASGKGGERLSKESSASRKFESRDRGVTPLSDYEARRVEEAFAERFEEAGVRFVDQKMARISKRLFNGVEDRFLTSPQTDKEREEVEALKATADYAIELLCIKKTAYLPTVSGGNETREQWEVAATAFDLRTGEAVARSSSRRLFKLDGRDGAMRERQMARLSSTEIVEQVSLDLMRKLFR